MNIVDAELRGMWFEKPVSFFDGSEVEPERMIEMVARNCYQSFGNIDETSHERLIATLDKSGHKTPKEFARLIIRFVTDRGVLAEITRHRLCGYTVESTRYVNSAKNGNCTFVRPVFVDKRCVGAYPIATSLADVETMISRLKYMFSYDDKTLAWLEACMLSEYSYMKMGKKPDEFGLGMVPQESRTSLNQSTKTEIFFYTTFRQLEQMTDLRMASPAHPEIQRAFITFMDHAIKKFPASFGYYKEKLQERKDFFESKNWDLLKVSKG